MLMGRLPYAAYQNWRARSFQFMLVEKCFLANRAMTPEVRLASISIDRKNDYSRHKEKLKIRCYPGDYGNSGFYLSK
jgi:hypothetical protein